MPKRVSSMSPEAIKLQSNLRLWRLSRGLTLAALAEQTGNKVSTLSGWENGHRAVDIDDLRNLAAHYGVHVAALLMTPEEANRKFAVMQEAASIAEKLPEGAAKVWLETGRHMVPPDAEED